MLGTSSPIAFFDDTTSIPISFGKIPKSWATTSRIAEAKARAPLGIVPHKFKEKGAVITVKPGNLRKSLKQRVYRGQRASMGNIQSIIPLDGRAFYGKFQEWGWKTKSGRYIAPQRFLAPAWQAKKEEAL